MQTFTDVALGGFFESAMNKIKAVLKGQAKEWVETLGKQVWASPKRQMFPADIPNALEILFNGIAKRQQVQLLYRSFASDQALSRVIEPVGVFHENEYWYVFAYCHLRKAYRQFRTDRITAIQDKDIAYTIQHDSLENLRRDYKDIPTMKVVISVDKEVVKFISDGRKHYGFVSEKDIGNEVEMTFLTYNADNELARWYMMFADCARVVEPESFRSRIKELTEKIRINIGS